MGGRVFQPISEIIRDYVSNQRLCVQQGTMCPIRDYVSNKGLCVQISSGSPLGEITSYDRERYSYPGRAHMYEHLGPLSQAKNNKFII